MGLAGAPRCARRPKANTKATSTPEGSARLPNQARDCPPKTVHAILRHDPVFTLGQAAGLVVYLRNLVLIARERRHQPLPPEA
jgi:hypothetical protein